MRSGDDDKGARKGRGVEDGYASVCDLKPEMVENLLIEAIYEHRRRLAHAERLYDKMENGNAKNALKLKDDYDRALQAHDSHQMVVQMLVDILGYIPRTGGNRSSEMH